MEELGIAESMLRKHGAVSRAVAQRLAESVREKAGVDIGLATTGIAGPAGATARKKLGLVYLALSSEAGTDIQKLEIVGARAVVIERAVSYSLAMLYRFLVSGKR
jgi:PncC family amidohydrolase